MEPEELLDEMQKQFSACKKSMEDEIDAMKKSLQEKEKELAEVRAETAVVQTENEERQILLDRANDMVATVPELKKKIEELEKCEEVWKAKLGETNKQLVDLRIQQLQLVAAKEEKAAAKFNLEKKQAKLEMEHRAASLRETHNENLARLVQLGEEERQEIEEKHMRLLEEREKMMVEHLKEEEMLQVQIAAAKQASGQSLVESWRLYYEQELKVKADELAALKQEEHDSTKKEDMTGDEGYTQEALGKPPTRQDDEEEGSADSPASTEAFVPQLNDAGSEVGSKEGLMSKEIEDIDECDVDDLLGGLSEDEDMSLIAKKPERSSLSMPLLSDRLQSMITTNDQPSSSLERTTSCRRKKLIRGDEESGDSQVKVEPATDATGLKEVGEGLQSRKTVDEVQKTSAEEEYTSVTEESQLRRSSRKRSMSRRRKEASDDSREENTPMEQKQRLEAGVGAKKTKMGNLRKCDLGGACVACNTPECGKCKFCLDK